LKGEQAAHDRVPVRKIGVHAGAPAPPLLFVGFDGGQGHLRIWIEHRLALGHANDDGERPIGSDEDGGRLAGFDGDRRCGAKGDRDGRPAADEHADAPRDPCRLTALAPAGLELDDGLGWRAVDGQAPDQRGGRQRPAGYLGDHGLGEGELPAVDSPAGLDGGGAGPRRRRELSQPPVGSEGRVEPEEARWLKSRG